MNIRLTNINRLALVAVLMLSASMAFAQEVVRVQVPSRESSLRKISIKAPSGTATGYVRGSAEIWARNPETWQDSLEDEIVVTQMSATVQIPSFVGNGGFANIQVAGYGSVIAYNKFGNLAKYAINDEGFTMIGEPGQLTQSTGLEGQLFMAGVKYPVTNKNTEFQIYSPETTIVVPGESDGLWFRLTAERGKTLALVITQISDPDEVPEMLDAGVVLRSVTTEAMHADAIGLACNSIRRIPIRAPRDFVDLQPHTKYFFNRMFWFPERNANNWYSLWFLPSSIQLTEQALSRNDFTAHVVAFGLNQIRAGSQADLIGFLYSPLGCHVSFNPQSFTISGKVYTIGENATVQDLIALYRAIRSQDLEAKAFVRDTIIKMEK